MLENNIIDFLKENFKDVERKYPNISINNICYD